MVYLCTPLLKIKNPRKYQVSKMDKKISFGFSKSIKKTTLQPKPKLENNKLQLIDSIEGQSIKIKNELPPEKGPLVIPLKKNETRLGNNHDQDDKTGNDGIDSTSRSLDEIAAEEILNDLKNAKDNKLNSSTFAIPSKKDKTNMDGEKEVTLDDYEDVPISEFGRAMLRGMGWRDEDAKKKTETVIAPRPKGLGLGADKLVKLTAKVAIDEKGEELKLIKGAFVKVVGGRHKDLYGQVDGMDDERGIIIVKMAIGREILLLSEFLLTPVPKTEYEKNSKVLNMTKYEEYKNDKKKSTKLSKPADSRSPSRNRSRSVSHDREKHSSKNKISDEQYEKMSNKRDNSSEDNESSNYSSRNKDRKYERNFEKRRYQNDKEKRVKKHSNNKRSRSSSSSDREAEGKYNQHSSRSKNNEKPLRKNRHSDSEDDDDRHSNHRKYKEKSHSRSKHSRRRSSTDSETKDKYSKYKKERNSTERYKTSERKNENDNSNEDKYAPRHKRDRSVERNRKSKYESNHHKHNSKKSKRRSRSRSR